MKVPLPLDRPHIAVIGAGFCGLAAAHELARHGWRVTVLERDAEIGGLAGSFLVDDVRLEKFYHHWFTSDDHIQALIDELGARNQVLERPARTGMYYAHRIFRLSTPLDLLRFRPLPWTDRLRLGWLVLRARHICDWTSLQNISASEWLIRLGGARVYATVWEPLLRGKFGDAAPEIAAVWIWNKLKLRGGSRGWRGEERLAYFRGGFAALADLLAASIRERRGEILCGSSVESLVVERGHIQGLRIRGRGTLPVDAVIATPALPIVAELVEPHVRRDYVERLRRIRYLSNLCIVLVLDRSLSSTYWLNVNDPDFPFVGVIEHTNFEPPASYAGHHIVYLSRYLPDTDAWLARTREELRDLILPHMRRMFPAFRPEWLRDIHVWRARYAQPLVERGYHELIPPTETPIGGLYLATMAQIYPEDRGTNHAVREGRRIADKVRRDLSAVG